MVRRLVVAVSLAFLALGAACSDAGSPERSVAPAPQVEAPPTPQAGGESDLRFRECPAFQRGDVVRLIALIFRGNGPEERTALRLIAQISLDRDRGRLERAQDATWELVQLIYRKKQERIPPETVTRLVNTLLCWVGLPPVPGDGESFLILPTDQPQVLVAEDRQAGVQLPANPVGEPSILVIEEIPDLRLNTKLDQYPGGVRITLSSPLVGTAVVAVCPSAAAAAPDLFGRLRVARGTPEGGVQILPEADPTPVGLECPETTGPVQVGAAQRVMSRVMDAVLPARLQAVQSRTRRGGVGGAASEFSPFVAVDPQLSFRGGAGGSASEFLRSNILSTSDPCPVVEGAIGSPLPIPCRPQVTITTALGTPFEDVPVTFTAAPGSGTVALEGANASCGAFATTFTATTSTLGGVRACWTLGPDAGVQTVRAVPSLGGDATPGVTFSPAALTFTATANPPAQFGFAGSVPVNVVAGERIVLRIAVQDRSGNTVVPASGTLRVTLNQGSLQALPAAAALTAMSARATSDGAEAATFSPKPPSTVDVPIVNGVATFDCCTITEARSGYVLRVSGQGLPTLETPAFSVVPGVPSQIFNYPDGVIVKPAGVAIASPVAVRVKDAFFNVITGLTVEWSTSTPGASITGATSTTDPDGFAGPASWTLAPGDNVLTASVVGYPSLVATFKGKGTVH